MNLLGRRCCRSDFWRNYWNSWETFQLATDCHVKEEEKESLENAGTRNRFIRWQKHLVTKKLQNSLYLNSQEMTFFAKYFKRRLKEVYKWKIWQNLKGEGKLFSLELNRLTLYLQICWVPKQILPDVCCKTSFLHALFVVFVGHEDHCKQISSFFRDTLTLIDHYP